MPSQLSADVATEVRSVVAKLGVKHVAIAAQLQISPMALSRRMRGSVSFTAEEIYALAAFLNVDVTELYPGAKPAQSTTTDSSGPASPDSPMNATPVGSDETPSPAATTGAAAHHVDVALAGETAESYAPAGSTGKARDQLAAASTRAFPAIAEGDAS